MLKNLFYKSLSSHLFKRKCYHFYPLLSFSSSSINSPSRPNFVYKDEQIYLDPLQSNCSLLDFMNLSDIQLRKSAIFIPHFTVGSILKVIWTDKVSTSGQCEFTGMCTRVCQHKKIGATFVLRNSTKTDCVSVTFELYSPIIRSIELLRFQEIVDPEYIDMLEELPPSFSFVDPNLDPIYTKTPIQFETRYAKTSVIPESQITNDVKAGKLEYEASVLAITKLYDPYYRLIKNNEELLKQAFQEKNDYTVELLSDEEYKKLIEPELDLTNNEIIISNTNIKNNNNISKSNYEDQFENVV